MTSLTYPADWRTWIKLAKPRPGIQVQLLSFSGAGIPSRHIPRQKAILAFRPEDLVRIESFLWLALNVPRPVIGVDVWMMKSSSTHKAETLPHKPPRSSTHEALRRSLLGYRRDRDPALIHTACIADAISLGIRSARFSKDCPLGGEDTSKALLPDDIYRPEPYLSLVPVIRPSLSPPQRANGSVSPKRGPAVNRHLEVPIYHSPVTSVI